MAGSPSLCSPPANCSGAWPRIRSGRQPCWVDRCPPPELDWRERNWLVGVWQRIDLRWDLSSLDPVAGLDLPLHLRPLNAPAVRLAEPIPTDDDPAGGRLWQLQPGAVNRLQLACWRWSALGLGAVAIGVAVLLVLVLQRLLPTPNG